MPASAEAIVIRHRRQDPLFIVGHGRSGTSILTNLIRKHLRIAFGTESQFFIRYYRQLARYGDLSLEENRQLLVADIGRERFFQRSRKLGLQLDAARVVREARPATYPGVVAAILGQFAESQEMDRWGDKTPEYSHHLPILMELFPTAQIVHVVRDGRDVALSGYHVHFGAKNAYKAASEWRNLLVKVRAFAQTARPECFLEVRYEDLLAQPQQVFERLIAFLDIDDPRGDLGRSVGQRVSTELRSGNFGKWKTGLSLAEQAMFVAVAGDMLEAYGYEVGPPARSAPGPLGRAYWEIDNTIRRMAVPGYWSDNLYKAQLRLHRLLLPLRSRRNPTDPRPLL